jgi:hypothetical protein
MRDSHEESLRDLRQCWATSGRFPLLEGVSKVGAAPRSFLFHLDISFTFHHLQINPVHRLFCGLNASPFTFPPLSRREAEDAKTHFETLFRPSNTAYGPVDSEGRSSLALRLAATPSDTFLKGTRSCFSPSSP